MNLATWIILLCLIAFVAVILRVMIRDKRKGKSCGGSCSGCSGCSCISNRNTFHK